MGKKRHAKDRAYITKTEWATEWGGFKAKLHAKFQQLPFHCCALTFTPFEDPVCTDDGFVYEIVHIVPYIQKFKKHPVTGAPLAVKDLTKLTFHKDGEGNFCCPVLSKVFTDSTHIVANKKSGHVYCMQAIEELNIKCKNWKDLITDEPFTRKDLIHIQDPMNLAQKELSKFDHVVKDLKVERAPEEPYANINCMASSDTGRVLASLGTDAAKAAFDAGGGGTKSEAERILAAAKQAAKAAKLAAKEAAARVDSTPEAPDSIIPNAHLKKTGVVFKPGAVTWNTDEPERDTASRGKKGKKKQRSPSPPADPSYGLAPVATKGIYLKRSQMQTTGAGSRAFTSSVCEPVTVNERAVIKMEKNPTKKGYVQLHTNMGDINLELHCDITPRTCENFLGLCETGYYNNVKFHRSIKNFMIQGGDPKGDGTGGQSIWKQPFKDELNSKLLHSGRGVVSMANSGPHSNGSQFFILYKSATHLDYKHTVFGKVVGGFETLSAFEKVQVDDNDRPKEDIVIQKVTIFVNPYAEDEEPEPEEEEPDEEAEQVGQWFSNPYQNDLKVHKSGIGKYIAPSTGGPVRSSKSSTSDIPPPSKKPKPIGGNGSFGSFDSW
mmetsp:Transcript_30121/g.57842  ORF Transcript_30121/g.57842 Transcript_30121/m.57842 type:complete len:606 (+) Transcript_30121:83-1900(+)